MLPTCMNLNPRSIYNKVQAFATFIKEHQVTCVFLSESWERPEYDLSQLLHMEDYQIISNPHQRKEVGGRPALVVSSKFYHVRNLTNSLIQIPWGCEATWALLTPKNVTNASSIQKIALCSLYCKPDSRTKTKLLDHISYAYNLLSAKFPTGLHFILAGDTNELKLDSILQLNPRMQQVVRGVTRLNPPRMLDPIITTLGAYYQTPEILAPLDADEDSGGRPSDHLIPLMRPINMIDNQCSRTYHEITVRPIHSSGLGLLRQWFEAQDWSQITNIKSVHLKAETLISEVLQQLNKYLPEKVIRVASDDEPWFTQALKKLDRKKRREFNKNRNSQKYKYLSRLYSDQISKAKKKYKRAMIDTIKEAKPGEWYSSLKRISRFDQGKGEVLQVEEISHLSDQEQAEKIADHQAAISNLYKGVELKDIDIPPFTEEDIPLLGVKEVKEYILKLKVKKATPPGDIPVKIIREFAQYLSVPLCNIINSSIKEGVWVKCYKKETITPIPKEHPVLLMEMLRPISSLCSFNKVQEMAVVEMVVRDMATNLDPTQYGNRKRTSIAHYLVRMLHRILSETDNNSRGEIKAVLCTFVDWRQAYSRQSHILGVRAFAENGVRPSLLPLLTSYFQNREIRVKWHGKMSEPRQMPGSGAMGSSLGNWEFDSQTNKNANCVPEKNRFKFVDDLSLLEIINLLNIGLSSLNVKNQVPNDLPIHGQFVDNSHLLSQGYLDEINRWTENQQMEISGKKTKAMIINFTNKYQFHTRLKLKQENVEIVDIMKILGTVITNQISWSENCSLLVKKVNARMQLLRKVWSFGSTPIEMVQLWKTFCRNILEQTCVVWDSGLTKENIRDLERTQKTFVKLVLEESYRNYETALEALQLDSLEKRRKTISLNFAKTAIADGHFSDLFPRRTKNHPMTRRDKSKYKVFKAHTERYKNSPILTMQSMPNNQT